MAAPGKGSKWGSFLSSAVAGMEARLDTILADTDGEQPAKQPPMLSPSLPPPSPKQSPGPSRSGSTNQKPDRLQERLARAVAAKNAAAGAKPEPSPIGSSAPGSPRQSSDTAKRISIDSTDRPRDVTSETDSARVSQDTGKRPSLEATAEGSISSPKLEHEKEEDESQKVQTNGERPSTDAQPPTPMVEVTPAPEEAPINQLNEVQESRIKHLEAELGELQRQHQEETHEYVEKIDALQSKLQYLARETTDAARKAIQEAPAGSAEKKLAEKDQQIAQLMEEGKNLGVTEQKHRAIMKKLRTKITEDEKEVTELKVTKAKALAELETLRVRAKRATVLEKEQEGSQKRVSQALRETESLRAEAASKDSTISELKAQLQRASEHAEAMTAKVNDEALAKERHRVRDLEEQVAALQVEKNLVADRGRIQANELKEKAERASERARVVELEMKAEVQIMESKVEAMRIRAEETSSGAIGDSQAKLLRQVETLQTQYSIASENWQGIEATLLARISNLEKEKEEALQRESDMRRKAREAALRAKRHEEELEDARIKLPTVQDDVKHYQSQLETLRKRAEQAEAALLDTKTELDKQKASWAEQKQDRDRERSDSNDRRQWLEDLPNPSFKTNSRPESPLMHGPARTWSADILGLQAPPNRLRKTSAPSSNDDLGDKMFVRRPSAQPSRPSAQASISGYPGPPSLFSPTIESLPTPLSANPLDQDDPMEGVERPASPQQVLQDMVSVSTVAAGPSVQLVERMSAAIRRLESEKVAAREELARISNQRDEARAEIVSHMRDAESGKSALKKVADLEAEVADVNARYETTLELLGEKSELVEELKADVQDVKAMYRDLVERTVK